MKNTFISMALISMMGLTGATATAAQSKIIYGYSGDITTNISAQQANTKLGAAMYVPEDIVATWGNSQLTGIRIGFGYGNAKTVNIFISEKLGDKPVYSQKANMKDSQWNDVTFETPYDVPATGFYIGYEITTKSAEDFPIGIDNLKTPVENAGYIEINGNWSNYSTQFGSVCIKAIVEGDNLPANDINTIGTPIISPYVGVNAEFPMTATITNNGAEAIESVTASCLVNGEELTTDITCTLSPASIAPGEFGVVQIDGLVYGQKGENLKVDVTIDSVNGGEDANPSNNLLSGTTTCVTNAYPRNFVVEEWTGTWCGNCPVGIVGMDYMNEHYGDERFIGIAVHGGSSTEPMYVPSYDGFISAFCNGGYPGCIINRTYTEYPFSTTLENYYLNSETEQTFANVEITDIDYSTKNEGFITVTSKTGFSISKNNARYRIAYVITENNVGPYTQSNYFAGGAMGALDGWEDKGQNVNMLFNEVARVIVSSLGVANSLPSTIEEDNEYEFSCEVPLTNVSDLGNCTVIALLLNGTNGAVENATKVKVPQEAKVESIKGDDIEVRAERGGIEIKGDYKKIDVYTLDGRKVASANNSSLLPLSNGLYIYNILLNDGTSKSGKVIIN